MNYGGDAADQIVRYSLEGTEVALKLTGEAAKNFAVFAAAVLKDQRKIRGKTNLTRLLRENKPLRFFEVPESRMKEFAREANVRGLLYVPVRDRAKAAGKIEFAVWAEDAAKVNRVLEKMGVDYLQADTGCALPGFVDSKNEEKTERNAGYLVVSHSGGGMLRQGTRKDIRRTPANRGMRAHWVVKGLDISEDVCHGMCP